MYNKEICLCIHVNLDEGAALQALCTTLEPIQQFLHVHSVEETRGQPASLEGATDQNCNITIIFIR